MAKLTAASPTSQAGLWHCCQTWGHWLKPRAELRGWLKGFRAGQWAGPGDAKGPSYGLNLLFFLLQCSLVRVPAFTMLVFWDYFLLYTAVTIFGSMAVLASGLADDLIFLIGSELCSEPWVLWAGMFKTGFWSLQRVQARILLLDFFSFYSFFLSDPWVSPKSQRKCCWPNCVRAP